ncbi:MULTISPECIES: invasion associated locus B family protein [Rhizobium/Agrobacterium group]|uniref:Invasion associated locus B family protein n=1 Tax=Rhizobium rhizogenes TaxID=359 RepID=A0A546X1D3_RHIRH|nr:MULTISPECIES: invasion associated locus B family protein [Rhizobium/Agrobacterium group]TRA94474.1 invasion associated locus B family protein [Rhizobium rhizogenes]
MRLFYTMLLISIVSAFDGAIAAAEDGSRQPFRLKPSDVVVPAGSVLGNYQRVVRPFENWELICDENLVSMKKICNVTQSIVDGEGKVAFSWSLAATDGGQPVMILRTRPDPDGDRMIVLNVPGRQKPVSIKIQACDVSVCTAFLPVGAMMREQIRQKATIEVSYSSAAMGNVSLKAPLAGLVAALAAIE